MQNRALVVDDETAVCELMESVLNSAGMQVLALTRSAEAESRLREEKFSLVLLDFCMPPPDGAELARRMRVSGFNNRTPLIILSDDLRPAALAEGFDAGANFFLYKPVDRTRLLKLVRATQGAIEQERRRFRRVPVKSKVLVRYGGEEVEGETIDVSLNGLLVCAPRRAPTGAAVRVSLYLLPGAKPIVGAGSVMRHLAPNQMGIQLHRLSATESERLQDFLLPKILQEGPEVGIVRA